MFNVFHLKSIGNETQVRTAVSLGADSRRDGTFMHVQLYSAGISY